MFFDWKIQLEKIQLTRDLSDNTMIYQGIKITPNKKELNNTRIKKTFFH